MPDQPEVLPSQVSYHVGPFDRFASRASSFVSRAWFFVACVLLVVVWAPSILILHDVDVWQLVINTITTIVTFLLVALLQNTQVRTDNATQQKLNAVAIALGELLDEHAAAGSERLREASRELHRSVGLEEHESS
ncbi:hypothetical protein Rai3103_14160 [Raineyella fluvialis]|uniref:Low affinity Fe/Cu permease n=2 Tax=Raineyella fluvialis TaxID=2662261 RepID=A0A5Q2FJ97_9ACTN|nr:hypothetical protein Rai3103_14160 [Raineyella fluvialis]